jgi:hypothetical protein
MHKAAGGALAAFLLASPLLLLFSPTDNSGLHPTGQSQPSTFLDFARRCDHPAAVPRPQCPGWTLCNAQCTTQAPCDLPMHMRCQQRRDFETITKAGVGQGVLGTCRQPGRLAALAGWGRPPLSIEQVTLGTTTSFKATGWQELLMGCCSQPHCMVDGLRGEKPWTRAHQLPSGLVLLQKTHLGCMTAHALLQKPSTLQICHFLDVLF